MLVPIRAVLVPLQQNLVIIKLVGYKNHVTECLVAIPYDVTTVYSPDGIGYTVLYCQVKTMLYLEGN